MGNLMFDTNEQLQRALTTLSIEKALLDVGKSTYDKVLEILNTEYNCYLSECYEHPEYLANVLKKLFGNAHLTLVKSINDELEQFTDREPVERFLQVVNR